MQIHMNKKTLWLLLSCFIAPPLYAATVNPIAITVGDQHALVLKVINDEATVWAWGSNTYGQLGEDPSLITHQFIPELITTLPTTIRDIQAGAYHNLALDENGHVWSWGQNQYGQLGDGTRQDRYTPQRIIDGNNVPTILSISVGANFNLALDHFGNVWAWGDNRRFQVNSNGNEFVFSQPVQVFGFNDPNVSIIGTGREHGLASIDTQLYGWGRGTEGQLTLDFLIDRNSPIFIPEPNHITQLSAGLTHSLAIDSNDQLWAWGLNNRGQIGNGSFVSPNEPALVFSDPNLVINTITAGTNHSLALDQSSQVWAWGDNSARQTGLNDPNTAIPTPAILNLHDTNIITLAAGDTYNLALDSQGLAWEWGQLDVNDFNDINEPTPVLVPQFPCVLDVNSRSGGQVIEPNVALAIYRLQDSIPVQAIAEPHHRFTGWCGSAVDSNSLQDPNSSSTTLTIFGDITLTASFEPITYHLTIESSDGGLVTTPGEGSYDVNNTLPITLVAERINDSYAFTGWELISGSGQFVDANKASTSFTIEADSHIKANFKPSQSAGLVEPLLSIVIKELKETHDITTTNPNTDDMALLETLDASRQAIKDLTGLEWAINIHTLNLNNNLVSDVNTLTEMPALQTLMLDNNDDPNLVTLLTMTDLKTLHLSNNPIPDFSVFQVLTNLEYLVLNNTNDSINDIPSIWLSTLTKLKVLSIRDNQGLRKSDINVQRILHEICLTNGGGVAVDK